MLDRAKTQRAKTLATFIVAARDAKAALGKTSSETGRPVGRRSPLRKFYVAATVTALTNLKARARQRSDGSAPVRWAPGIWAD
jgi:hypothetical protein